MIMMMIMNMNMMMMTTMWTNSDPYFEYFKQTLTKIIALKVKLKAYKFC